MSEENEKQEGSLGTITSGRALLFHAAGVFCTELACSFAVRLSV